MVLVEKIFLQYAQQLEEDWSEHDLSWMEGGEGLCHTLGSDCNSEGDRYIYIA